MTASVIRGPSGELSPYSWRGSVDDEWWREYYVTFLVKTTSTLDGPQVAMEADGLPAPGDSYLIDNEDDEWAFCYPTRRATIHKEVGGDPNRHWQVECKFSNRPLKRCPDSPYDDPLLEPPKLSGNFVRYMIEGVLDRNGNFIKTSSHERIQGSQNEWDANRPMVRIEQNVPSLKLALFSQMIDHVNDAPLWGLAARCIKLSNVIWERKTYGLCNFYYTRMFEFDISYSTFDRDPADIGRMVLNGHWKDNTDSYSGDDWVLDKIGGRSGPDPDPNNPTHFIIARDRSGEPMQIILDGAGQPANEFPGTGGRPAARNHIEFYGEANFLELGIPTSF